MCNPCDVSICDPSKCHNSVCISVLESVGWDEPSAGIFYGLSQKEQEACTRDSIQHANNKK